MKTLIILLMLSGFAVAETSTPHTKSSSPAHESFVNHETSGHTWTQRGKVVKRSVVNAAHDTGHTVNGWGKSVANGWNRTFNK